MLCRQFLYLGVSPLGCRIFSCLSKEGMLQKWPVQRRQGLLCSQEGLRCPLWSGHNLPACHQHLPGPSIPVALAFIPSPIFLCDFPRWGLCPWQFFHQERSSYSFPYLSPASTQLIAPQIILFLLSESDTCFLRTTQLFSSVPIPVPSDSSTFDSCPFQPKEPVNSVRAGTMPSTLTAPPPGLCLAYRGYSVHTCGISEEMNERPRWCLYSRLIWPSSSAKAHLTRIGVTVICEFIYRDDSTLGRNNGNQEWSCLFTCLNI